MNQYIVLAKFIKRTNTNDNEKAKQTFRIIGTNNENVCLSIHKLVLTDNRKLYDKVGFELLRIWKGKFVFKQVFSIKLSTLGDVVNWITSLNK